MSWNTNHPMDDHAMGLSDRLPGVAITYEQFTGQCFDAGELDAKTKQLIALGVALFANNANCSHYYIDAARALGATDLQIMETAAVASAAASGHVLLQGALRAQPATTENMYQASEFADELYIAGMDIPGESTISPSY